MSAELCLRAARAVMVVLAVTTFIAPARAQQPSPSAIATARELLNLEGANNLYEGSLETVIDRVKGVFLQTNPALGKDINEATAQLRAEYQSRVNDLANEVARFYAQRFTEQELKDMLVFFKTPLGKKYLTEKPKLLDESFGRLQQWQDRISEDVLIKVRAEMRKKGHNL